MYLEKDRAKLFSRRAAVIWGGKLALFAGLTARLHYLQISSADHYRLMAEDNRINIQLLPPPRGAIVDRTGEQLAVNVQNYRIRPTAPLRFP
jgi:penicillin-binding protein 2